MSSITLTHRRCEFWLGRAGAGKTYGCLVAIANELKRSPRGQPLILLTPEQSTAQMERRLGAWPGLLGGYTRARVFSFHFLAREAFVQAGGAPNQPLGDLGRLMLLRQALRRRQDGLQVFGHCAGQMGVVESLSGAILEFQRYGWSADDLDAWIEAEVKAAGDSGKDGHLPGGSLLGRKLRDIAVLWHDYEGALKAGGWEDPARLYEAAARAIRRWPELDGARIWIDGFASFTAMEMELLDALLEHAESVVFALCADPIAIELGASQTGPGGTRPRPKIGPERLFENNEESFQVLRDRMLLGGWDVRLKALPAQGQPGRFADSPALAHLEKRVLGRIAPEPCPEAAWRQSSGNFAPGEAVENNNDNTTDNHNTISIAPTHGQAPIELIEAADRRAEVEAVARRIVCLCRREAAPARPSEQQTAWCGGTLLWRDIALLARDLKPYEAHLREVFTPFEIPFFIDRPREMEGHPLERLILSALVVLRAGWAGDAVLQHLKCGLAGLRDEEAIARIENQIRAVDPHGSHWKDLLERDPVLNASWQAAAQPLRRLEASLREGQPPARALWEFISDVQAATTLDGWIQSAQDSGQEELIQLHEQAWEQTVAWLEEFEQLTTALPDFFDGHMRTATFREQVQELIEWVESALASTRARLIPPTLNQVTIGSVERSRTPEVKVLFVLGLNDGEFPKNWMPDAILGDDERERLTRRGRRLGPDSPRKRLQEHFLAYVALTRPSQKLVLSRPMVDDEGRVGNPSPTFTTVARMFPLAPVHTVRRAGEQDDPGLPLRPEEWALRLSMALGRIEDLGQATALASAIAGGVLLRHANLAPAQRRGLELARRALAPPPPAHLDPVLARSYWSGQSTPTLPVTALEVYGACPFKFFIGTMLRLKERLDARLSGMDIGTIRHEILDRLFTELRGDAGLDWSKIDQSQAEALIDRTLVDMRRHAQWGARLQASALGDLTLREVGSDMKLLVRALQLAGRRCALIQVESEWKFGSEDLLIETDSLRFAVRGTVDRIDAVPFPCGDAGPRAAVLIDYKSGQRRLNLGRIMDGIDLQLLTYGLAYRQATARDGRGPTRIGGIFYWPISAPIKDAEPGEAPDAPLVDEGWFVQRAPSGMFEEDLAKLLDTEVAPKGKAAVFGFRLKDSGAINNSGQAHWPPGAIDRLLEHERRLLERWATRIVSGEIGITPFIQAKATACDLCDYQGACRRADPGVITYRVIGKFKRDEVLAALEATPEAIRP